MSATLQDISAKKLIFRCFMHKKSHFTKALAAGVANTPHIQTKVSQEPGGQHQKTFFYYYYLSKQSFLLFKYLKNCKNCKIFEWLKNTYSTSN